MAHHKGTNPRTGRGVSQRHPGVPSQLPNFYSSGTNPRTGHWTACLCPVKDVADVTVEPPQENRERGKKASCVSVVLSAALENRQLRRCPARPHPPSPVSLSGVFPATGHNGRHPKNWLLGTPLCSPLYSQGRCLRRAHCGSLRAGTGAARDVCPLAVFFAVSEGVYTATTSTVFLWSIFLPLLCLE